MIIVKCFLILTQIINHMAKFLHHQDFRNTGWNEYTVLINQLFQLTFILTGCNSRQLLVNGQKTSIGARSTINHKYQNDDEQLVCVGMTARGVMIVHDFLTMPMHQQFCPDGAKYTP